MLDMTTAKNRAATSGKPETMFQEVLILIGDSLRDLANSDDEQDGEDEEDHEEGTELGKLSDQNGPSWVIGTITKTVQHRMERFRSKQMILEELTDPGWGDGATNFCEGDIRYITAKLNVPVDVKPQIEMTTATACLITVGEPM
jgi:hypothetical protein